MVSQIPLNLNLLDEMTFSSYYPGNNAALLPVLYKAAVGRGERLICLWGSAGSGCTHLLQACCHEANQKQLRVFYLNLSVLDQMDVTIFNDLEWIPLVCIDDIHCIAGNRDWEEALFGFFNRMQESGRRLIIAGHAPIGHIPFCLPDLQSRLQMGLIFHVHALSDEEKIKALQLRAHYFDYHLPSNVAEFILKRYSRHLTDLFALLNQLSQLSLQEKRKITIPFVKSMLGL